MSRSFLRDAERFKVTRAPKGLLVYSPLTEVFKNPGETSSLETPP